MTWQDYMNGAYELLAGFAVLAHCWELYKAKRLSGVSWPATVFFTSWGVWNLYYYPHLGQWASFVGGVSIVSANALWLSLMYTYRGKS